MEYTIKIIFFLFFPFLLHGQVSPLGYYNEDTGVSDPLSDTIFTENPLDYADTFNLQLWIASYDINANDTFNQETPGANLTEWKDKSGNAHDVTLFNTPTVDDSLYNGNLGVHFNNAATEYGRTALIDNLATDQHYTIFWAGRPEKEGGNSNQMSHALFALGTSTSTRRICVMGMEDNSPDQLGMRFFGGSQLYRPNPIDLDSVVVVSVRWAGAGSGEREFELDGVYQSPFSTSNANSAHGFTTSDDQFMIAEYSESTSGSPASTQEYDGQIFEVFLFYTDVPDWFRRQFTDWMMETWKP